MAVDVFLSHNWGKDISYRNNHDRVALINEELKKIGYQTWFDTERIRGGIMKKMSEGIEQAKGVIVFITCRYHEKVSSPNGWDCCHSEFEYALRKKTKFKMVAVVMEKCMCDTSIWIGLIGMGLGGDIFVDMSGDLENRTYLSEKLKDLNSELQSKGINPSPGISISILI